MDTKHGCAGLVLAVVLSLSGAARAAPPDAFTAAPSIDLVRLSPEGARLAFIQGRGDQRIVVIQSIQDRRLLMRLPIGAVSVRSLVWGDADHVIVGFTSVARLERLVQSEEALSAGGAIGANPLASSPSAAASNAGEWRQALSLDVRTKTFWPLLNTRVIGVGPMLNVVTDDPVVRTVDGSPWVFLSGVRYVGSRPSYALFRTSLDGRTTELVDPGNGNPAAWLVGPDGRGFVRLEYVLGGRRWRLLAGGDHRSPVERMSLDAAYGVPLRLGVEPSTGAALIQSAAPKGETHTFSIPFTGDAPVVAHEGPALERIVADEGTGDVVEGVAETGRLVDFSAPEALARARLEADNPGAAVRLEAAASAAGRYVFVVVGGTRGCSYWLVEKESPPALVGDRYDDIQGDAYAKGARRSSAQGGEEAPAPFFTRPSGLSGKPPLIVLFRAPSWRSDPVGADWLVQSLAAAGFAVLEASEHEHPSPQRPPPRGSTGTWRSIDADEAMSHVESLIHEGAVDPDRICAIGHGYGAMAAVDLAARAPGRIGCVAAVAGAFEPSTMLDLTLNRGVRGDPMSIQYATAFGGAVTPWADGLDGLSPYKRLAMVKAPILLIHGRDDGVVAFSQSRDFYTALVRAGASARLVGLKGADHWIYASASRRAVMDALADFLKSAPPSR